MTESYDVIGVGALNVDHHVDKLTTTALSTLLERPIEEGTETPVDAATIETVLGHFAADATPGGSAYNTITTLAATYPDLRLGYVGVAGRGFARSSTSRIDQRHVLVVDEALTGTCIAYTEAGERTLLTHAGANTLMAHHLETSFEAIVAYLTSARFVHVTSFLDSETPPRLLQVLRAVRAAGTRISVDPGHAWATAPTPTIDEILATADHLFVNDTEFRALAVGGPGESDDVLAARLRVRSPNATVVLKRPDGIRTYGPDGHHYLPQTPIPPDAIQEATGAGDAFAAGFLAALTSPRLSPADASAQGLTLARRKLLT